MLTKENKDKKIDKKKINSLHVIKRFQETRCELCMHYILQVSPPLLFDKSFDAQQLVYINLINWNFRIQ